MNKEKIQYIVAGGLILVFIFVLMSSPKKESAVEESSDFNTVAEDFSSILSQYGDIMKHQWDPSVVKAFLEKYQGISVERDPFELKVVIQVVEEVPEEAAEAVEEEPLPKFEIQGVLYNQSKPSESIAMVAGEEKKIGDEVSGWRIVTIRDNTVVFQKGNRQHAVNLYA